jgi:hypothetical protein
MQNTIMPSGSTITRPYNFQYYTSGSALPNISIKIYSTNMAGSTKFMCSKLGRVSYRKPGDSLTKTENQEWCFRNGLMYAQFPPNSKI